LQRLEDVGVAELTPTGEVRIAEGESLQDKSQLHEAAMLAVAEQDNRRDAGRERLETMRAYAETTGCRRELLLRSLGDEYTGPCNFCDNCETRAGRVPVDPAVGTRREVT